MCVRACVLLLAVAQGAGAEMCGLDKAVLCDELFKLWPHFI